MKTILPILLCFALFSCGGENNNGNSEIDELKKQNKELLNKVNELTNKKDELREGVCDEADSKVKALCYWKGFDSDMELVKKVFLYDDGKPHVQENYKNGKKDGQYIRWHYNGPISYKIEFKEGDLHGDFKEFNKDGSLRFHCVFTDDKLDEVIYGKDEYQSSHIQRFASKITESGSEYNFSYY